MSSCPNQKCFQDQLKKSVESDSTVEWNGVVEVVAAKLHADKDLSHMLNLCRIATAYDEIVDARKRADSFMGGDKAHPEAEHVAESRCRSCAAIQVLMARLDNWHPGIDQKFSLVSFGASPDTLRGRIYEDVSAFRLAVESSNGMTNVGKQFARSAPVGCNGDVSTSAALLGQCPF